VSSDFICSKKYVAISKTEIGSYNEISEELRRYAAGRGLLACTQEWSDTYNINNYRAECSPTNECQAIYQRPD
jgi:hypothetical protein